ncbi:LOW QUALITY PROTEIN: inactive heparanase-2 [Sardina pilchardus]|uniref:LOW QUALITY PROTEIN: inactive heparanase-2 n=1 Tax=Sardina pilchardus TaxID=27697 RepID=UPI002E145AA3
MPRPLLTASFGSSLWLALMVQSLVSSTATYKRPVNGGKRPGFLERTLILLDVHTRGPVKVLNENFLSLQLDPAIIKDGWLDFLSSRRLVTLARGLSPAYLRFGGKRTDFLRFHNLKNLAKVRGPGPDYYLKNYEDDIVRSDIALDKLKGCRVANHPSMMLELQREKAAQMQQTLLKEQQDNIYSDSTITARSLDKLHNFADCAGMQIVFGLNGLQRNPDCSWNSSNALSLLKYSASKKYNMTWELGNEPNGYPELGHRCVNGSLLAHDLQTLRTLLQSVRFYSRTGLYGPNTGQPRKNSAQLLEGFLKHAGSMVDVITWQHYYADRRVSKVDDFLKTRLLDTLNEQIIKVLKIVATHAPAKKVWLGGFGPAWAGGTNNLSDTFAASFLWLNTLGISALHGIDVVLRHSFFDYGYSHLVDQHFNPLPDYWLSLLFKRLVGQRVLSVQVAGLQRRPRPGRVIRDKLRIYAHCTSSRSQSYTRGSITIFISNLHRSRKKIKLAGSLRNRTVQQYLLQPLGPEGLHSRSMLLNGEPLQLQDDDSLPELRPRTLRAGRTIAMPPTSIGFYVIKNINAYACRR